MSIPPTTPEELAKFKATYLRCRAGLAVLNASLPRGEDRHHLGRALRADMREALADISLTKPQSWAQCYLRWARQDRLEGRRDGICQDWVAFAATVRGVPLPEAIRARYSHKGF